MAKPSVSTDAAGLDSVNHPPSGAATLGDVVPALLRASEQHDQVLTSIVIPAFNEEQALPLVLKSVYGIVDSSFEVVVVDDGSTDRSAAVASDFPCRLIQHPRNMGKGAALRTGLQHARGRYVVFIDADNTYPVELIPAMVRLMEHYDLVRGVRLLQRDNTPPVNRLGSLLFDWMIHLLHPVEGDDLLSGMYGGRRERMLELELESNGFDIETEINVKAQAHGLTFTSLPITYSERVGEKKLKPFRDGLCILYRLLRLTLAFHPLLVFIFPGLLLFGIGLLGTGLQMIAPVESPGSVLAGCHPFMVGAIAALGVQLVIFGMAVYSAGMAHGLRGRANQRLDRAVELFSTPAFALVGIATALAGAVDLAWLIVDTEIAPRALVERPVLAAVPGICLLIGCQMLSATAFLSALRGLQSHMPYEKSR